MPAEAFAELQPQEQCPEIRKSILIIDDDHDQVDVLSLRLHNLGFETFSADTGSKGISLAHDRKPHLVLLDLRLPDLDGLSVCQQLADDSRTCDIPVIIVSGMERSDVVRISRSAGCRFYVRKPYDPNALLVLIESALGDTDLW